jgi:hypothetical protein
MIEKEIVRIRVNIIELLKVIESPVVFRPIRSTASSCTAAVSGNNIERI